MPELRCYHIFISHAWRYSEDYYRLEEMLKNAVNFNFHNYSVPRHDPLIDPNTTAGNLKLENMLNEQMSHASVFLVISGMYVAYKKWIQYEIDFAVENKKPIIGIIPRGHEQVPQYVSTFASVMVGWSTDSIVSAIRRYAL